MVLGQDYPGGTDNPVDMNVIMTAIDTWANADGFAYCYMMLQQQLHDTLDANYLRVLRLTPIPNVVRSTLLALIHLVARHGLGLPPPFDVEAIRTTTSFTERPWDAWANKFQDGLPYLLNHSVKTITLKIFLRPIEESKFTQEFKQALLRMCSEHNVD
jgi:hypothetical protein